MTFISVSFLTDLSSRIRALGVYHGNLGCYPKDEYLIDFESNECARTIIEMFKRKLDKLSIDGCYNTLSTENALTLTQVEVEGFQ